MKQRKDGLPAVLLRVGLFSGEVFAITSYRYDAKRDLVTAITKHDVTADFDKAAKKRAAWKRARGRREAKRGAFAQPAPESPA
jgi:hypothetical protein